VLSADLWFAPLTEIFAKVRREGIQSPTSHFRSHIIV